MRNFYVYNGWGHGPEDETDEELLELRKKDVFISNYAIVCIGAGAERPQAIVEFQEIVKGLGLYCDGQIVMNRDLTMIEAALFKAGWEDHFINPVDNLDYDAIT